MMDYRLWIVSSWTWTKTWIGMLFIEGILDCITSNFWNIFTVGSSIRSKFFFFQKIWAVWSTFFLISIEELPITCKYFNYGITCWNCERKSISKFGLHQQSNCKKSEKKFDSFWRIFIHSSSIIDLERENEANIFMYWCRIASTSYSRIKATFCFGVFQFDNCKRNISEFQLELEGKQTLA